MISRTFQSAGGGKDNKEQTAKCYRGGWELRATEGEPQGLEEREERACPRKLAVTCPLISVPFIHSHFDLTEAVAVPQAGLTPG